MSREEDLCRRLCRYFGIIISTVEDEDDDENGFLKFVPSVPLGEFAQRVVYSSWHNALFGCFGIYGLNNLRKFSYDEQWYKLKSKAFEYSSLDELEMQLSVRGF